MKQNDDDDLPLKQKRLRDKKESRAKQRIKNLHHDSRPLSQIVEDIESDDKFLED
jgi:hypothetical protein